MARYPLILKDQTYVKILQQAAKEGKTFGKKANEILNEWAEREMGESKLVCELCEREPQYEYFTPHGERRLRCQFHKPNLRSPAVRGFRELAADVVGP